MESCKNANNEVHDHFVGAAKTIDMPKGATKEIVDYKLTRYACYLIAQNADPRKEEIAFAQSYQN
jgi:DNA-damage-inducible protein D